MKTIRIGWPSTRTLFALLASFLLMSLLAPAALRAQDNLRAGIWVLNVARSQYRTGKPPMNQTRTHEAQGDTMNVTVRGVAADGSEIAYGYSYKLDGKDYPMAGPQYPYGADSVSVKTIDPSTFDITTTKAGKRLVVTRSAYSADGKVLTMTSKGADAGGHPIDVVAVYDKRP